MKTSSAKAKGRRASQEVKDMLLVWDPDLQSDDIVVTGSGDTGEDLKLSPKAREIYPYSIECKNVEKLNVWQALEQAKSHSSEHTPLLCFRRNRSEMFVALKFEDFLKLTR